MIKDLDELKKLLILCRAQGVTEIELTGCHIKLGEKPKRSRATSDEAEGPVEGQLTGDDLIFYSAGAGNENLQG